MEFRVRVDWKGLKREVYEVIKEEIGSFLRKEDERVYFRCHETGDIIWHDKKYIQWLIGDITGHVLKDYYGIEMVQLEVN